MNTFDQETGVFHWDDPSSDFTIEMDGRGLDRRVFAGRQCGRGLTTPRPLVVSVQQGRGQASTIDKTAAGN